MVSSIQCRYRALGDLPTGRPAASKWLSPAEHRVWNAMRSQQRQITWLAGRVLAKQLLVACWSDDDSDNKFESPAEIHIESRSASNRLGIRPRVSVRGQELDWGLSISHSKRGVLVAVAADASVGVDLVCPNECRGESLAWCFSAAERCWLAALPSHGHGAERLWAMKEAVFKACPGSQGFAPQRIEIVPGSPACSGVRRLQCWRVDSQVAALAVADWPASSPESLPFELLRESNHD
jgi:phosphopantetheinyl transferase